VPSEEHFGDSLRGGGGGIDPVTPTISVKDGGYTPDAQVELAVEMENWFPWPTLNLRRGIGMFPCLGPANGWEGPKCYPSATPRG
jgi:hypothetical protein